MKDPSSVLIVMLTAVSLTLNALRGGEHGVLAILSPTLKAPKGCGEIYSMISGVICGLGSFFAGSIRKKYLICMSRLCGGPASGQARVADLVAP